MENRDPMREMRTAPPAARQKLAAAYYDRGYSSHGEIADPPPSRRRKEKMALYRSVIGDGHRAILEIGCGRGDLTCALAGHAEKIVGTDISSGAIALARKRKSLWLSSEQAAKVEFLPMSAVQLDFPDGAFDWAVSTSVVEHLHPDDVSVHMREVRRVLRPGGSYLMWCPNGLGHHKDREYHLTMWSYREWIEKLSEAGFRNFRSTLTSRLPLVDARVKVFLERALTACRIKLLWSHLGVRNVFLVGVR